MIKNIVKDIEFLKIKSTDCDKSDSSLFVDLYDTLKYNRKTCVGMAANMIGYNKSIICVVAETKDLIAIEKTNEYKGVYHVLQGMISPVPCFYKSFWCQQFYMDIYHLQVQCYNLLYDLPWEVQNRQNEACRILDSM